MTGAPVEMGKREHGEFFLLPQLLTRVGDEAGRHKHTNKNHLLSGGQLFLPLHQPCWNSKLCNSTLDQEETRPHEEGGENETHLFTGVGE